MRIAALAVVALAGLVAWTAPSMAQENGGDCPDHMTQVKEALNLTDEQATRIEAIVAEAMPRHEAIHETQDEEAAHEQMKAHHEATIARVNEVLNEEQRAKLEQMHGEMMARHEGGHCGAGGVHGDH